MTSVALEAVIFDTDGVITRTATVHFAAWKRVFDAFLTEQVDHGVGTAPFTEADYRQHVDGIPRYDGVAAFLASRHLALPHGTPQDPPGHDTVCALGNTKNEAFLAALGAEGVEPYRSTAELVGRLHARGVRTAVISASRNCAAVLEAAGVAQLFEVRVDGLDAEALGLAGKPAPDVFLEAARRLGVDPGAAAVVEDAISGVEAARRGGFAQVVGFDRTRHRDALARFADLVVPDAADLEVTGDPPTLRRRVPARTPMDDLPNALADGDVARCLSRRDDVAVFLDYDGTLTPIVARPEDAVLSPAAAEALAALGELTAVGVVSGRDIDDVLALVAGQAIWVSGSHGFEVQAPDGTRTSFDAGAPALPALDAAELELAGPVGAVEGAWVERKRFAIAVHHRATPDGLVAGLEADVAAVADAHDELRLAGGKKIFELRPAIDWDKGKAVTWLVEAAGLDPAGALTIFLGDDVTDEDAFVAVRDTGIGIVVGTGERDTAAHARLEDPDEVVTFLRWLTAELAPAESAVR